MTHLAIQCPYHERSEAIADVIQVYSGKHGRTMIFTSTKAEAHELTVGNVLKTVGHSARCIVLYCTRLLNYDDISDSIQIEFTHTIPYRKHVLSTVMLRKTRLVVS